MEKKPIVLAFGTRTPGDSLALDVARGLKVDGVEFREARSLDDALDAAGEERKLFIMDVVKGIKRIELIDAGLLRRRRVFSLHDLDVGFFLQLLSATGGTGVKIIGIPWGMDRDGARKEVAKLLEKIA